MSTSFNSPNYPNNFKNNMGEIRDLEGVARQLNQKSDGLQAALKKINDRLNQLNLGLEVWVGDTRTHGYLCYGPHVSSHDLGRPDLGNVTFLHAWDLGYAKVGDNWGLAVREVWAWVGDRDDNTSSVTDIYGETKSLLSAPRNVRIASAGMISSLIDDMKKQAESAVKDIENAEELADEL